MSSVTLWESYLRLLKGSVLTKVSSTFLFLIISNLLTIEEFSIYTIFFASIEILMVIVSLSSIPLGIVTYTVSVSVVLLFFLSTRIGITHPVYACFMVILTVLDNNTGVLGVLLRFLFPKKEKGDGVGKSEKNMGMD